MAFWSSETVKKRVDAEKLIDPYNPERVMRGAYELSVGGQAYISSSTGEKTTLGDGERIVIPPGQFGLLVTKETVAVPNDAMAFLSIKSTTKLQGLVNVSGFHVDPGYSNTLKFAVYNAGPQSIYLDQDQPMFLIWYAALDHATEDLYKPRPGLSKDITGEDVKRIAGDVASPAQLKEQFEKLKSDLDKRLHGLESNTDKRIHSIETRQGVIQALLGAVLVGMLLTFAKFILERPAEKSAPAATAQGAAAATAVQDSPQALPKAPK